MKIIILLFSLLVILKIQRKIPLIENTDRYFYTKSLLEIIYQVPFNLTNDIKLTIEEQKVFGEFAKVAEYTPRVAGGWVRDKILKSTPRDIDIVINLETKENLENYFNKIFHNINSSYPDLSKDPKLFRSPYEHRDYGFCKVVLFGRQLDVSILSANKTVVPPCVKKYFILNRTSHLHKT